MERIIVNSAFNTHAAIIDVVDVEDATIDTLTIDSITATTFTDGVATIIGGDITGLVSLSSTTITDGTASLTGGNLTGVGTATASTLTGGTVSVNTGNITGATSMSSGTITTTTLDVGNSQITGGNITVSGAVDCDSIADTTGATIGGTNVTGVATATATEFTDGTASLTGGNLTTTGVGNTVTAGTVTTDFIRDPDLNAIVIGERVLDIASTTAQNFYSFRSGTIADGNYEDFVRPQNYSSTCFVCTDQSTAGFINTNANVGIIYNKVFAEEPAGAFTFSNTYTTGPFTNLEIQGANNDTTVRVGNGTGGDIKVTLFFSNRPT